MSPQVVRAAGIIVFRQMDSIEYLMMKASYGSKHWTPPKGHVDPGEDLKETALRETEEEAGLKYPEDIKLVEDFSVETKYEVKSHKDSIVRPKIVTYYLARINEPCRKIKLSEEHTEYKWLSIDDALDVGGFDNMLPVFQKCEEKIKSEI